MRDFPEANILTNLSRDDFMEFRQLVVDMVLATDMSFHFSQLKSMKAAISQLAEPVEKSKALSLVLHTADISHPAKQWDIHYKWTMLVIEEFFRQGDREAQLGIPFSPLCDRHTLVIPDSQIGFINYIVAPSMEVCGDMMDRIVFHPTSATSPASSPVCENPDDIDQSQFRVNRPWDPLIIANKEVWKQKSIEGKLLPPSLNSLD